MEKKKLRAKEDQLWSILPSYHMYNSIYRNIHLENDEADDDVNNILAEPPTYNASILSSPSSSVAPSMARTPSTPSIQYSVSTPSTSSIQQSGVTPPTLVSSQVHKHTNHSFPLSIAPSYTSSRFVLANELANWQETILDNTHLLKNLTDSTNKESDAVNIDIHFTKELCELGQEPEEIDPSLFEYKQGDYLNGYVLIRNTLDEPIPFEMFYLVFEGAVKIMDLSTKKYIHQRNFLQMFDFSGSWNQAHIHRLFSDNSSPYACPDARDYRDGSHLSFQGTKIIRPGQLYKRFFTFKIPNFLLDTECSEHNLTMHVELPPSLGDPRMSASRIQKGSVKDFSMIDSSISYGVLARFVGRKSKYKVDPSLFNNDNKILINSKGDEFLILKECNKFVRILQQTSKYSKQELSMKYLQNKLLYNNLQARFKGEIEFGEKLLAKINDDNYNELVNMTTTNQLAKMKQSYNYTKDCKTLYNPNKVENYVYSYLLKSRKSFKSKTVGTLQLTTPKTQYAIQYIPPKQFRGDGGISFSNSIEIPLNFKFSSSKLNSGVSAKNLPEIKYLGIDLVALTYESHKFPIPVEFNHDLIFNPDKCNSNTDFADNDIFQNNVIGEFEGYARKLYELSKKSGSNLKIEKQLLEDLKSMSQLKTKSINLKVEDIEGFSEKTFNSMVWKENGGDYEKKINVKINLDSLRMRSLDTKKSSVKAHDLFTLVPNFQCCRMGRMYYIKISIGLSTGEYMHIKLPVVVQK